MQTELKQKERGIQAKRLLENELLKFWFEDVEKRMFEAFKKANLGDAEALKNVKARIDMLEVMKKELNQYVIAGKNAEKVLSEQ